MGFQLGKQAWVGRIGGSGLGKFGGMLQVAVGNSLIPTQTFSSIPAGSLPGCLWTLQTQPARQGGQEGDSTCFEAGLGVPGAQLRLSQLPPSSVARLQLTKAHYGAQFLHAPSSTFGKGKAVGGSLWL